MTRRKRAFTLIEILAAIAILLIVLSAALTLYHAALRAGERVEQQFAAASVEHGLHGLLRDLNCAVHPESEPACAFQLETDSATRNDGGVQLRFCCTTPFDNPRDPRWYGIENVTYRWTAGDRALIRVSSPVSGRAPAPNQTNVTASGIEHMTLFVFDGKDWQSSWSTGGLPRAARVIWQARGQSFTAETFIASGITVTNRRARMVE